MAKKRKKKTKGRKRKKAVQPQTLPALGVKQLEGNKFTEAIKTFRQLQKNDGDECWLPFLSRAYRGRIKQLAAKGMAKEALVIYANMIISGALEDHWLHINLLLKNGHYQQAIELFATLDKSLGKEQRQAGEEILAALILSSADQVLKHLPDNSLLKKHYPLADQALKAYCQGEYDVAESHLQNISFRSPYKNFRLALKGMLIFAENRHAAAQFFGKISKNSPFFHWLKPYRQLNSSVQPNSMLSRTEKQVVQTLEGIDKSTKTFLDGIRARQNEPFKLYSFLVTQGSSLGRDKLQNICFRLLIHAPDRFTDYQQRFGSFTEFEFNQQMALSSEVEHDYWNAADSWQDALHVLEKNKDPQDHLKIALICRHCTALLQHYDDEDNFKQIETLLEKSLEYDPHDRDTYFRLIEINNNSPAKRYKITNRALKEFPADIEVLFRAIEAALGRSAFKKASGLAAKLLKIDPINKKARLLLINAHLEHGRKLAGTGKFELALKQCHSAVSYDRANLGQGDIEICHGLILLLSGGKDKGLLLHDEGVAKAGHHLLGCFQASLEARLLQMPNKWLKFFDKNLRAACKTAPDNDTLLALTTKLHHCNDKKQLQLEKFRKIITPWLKKGVKLELCREEYLSLCAVFHHRRYFDLLEIFGKQAHRLWPNRPLPTFYYLCGKTEAGKKQLSMDQFEQLSDAMHAAFEQNDSKTAKLIDDLIQMSLARMGPGSMGFGLFANKILGKFADMLDDDEFEEDLDDDFINKLIEDMDQY